MTLKKNKNISSQVKGEKIIFEEVQGQDNLVNAKIYRDGKLHVISVIAISEDDFNKVTERDINQKDLYMQL